MRHLGPSTPSLPGSPRARPQTARRLPSASASGLVRAGYHQRICVQEGDNALLAFVKEHDRIYDFRPLVPLFGPGWPARVAASWSRAFAQLAASTTYKYWRQFIFWANWMAQY